MCETFEQTKEMRKDYPEWTVERCICYVGHFRSDCPYAVPEELEVWKEHESHRTRLHELGVDIEEYGSNRMLK